MNEHVEMSLIKYSRKKIVNVGTCQLLNIGLHFCERFPFISTRPYAIKEKCYKR